MAGLDRRRCRWRTGRIGGYVQRGSLEILERQLVGGDDPQNPIQDTEITSNNKMATALCSNPS